MRGMTDFVDYFVEDFEAGRTGQVQKWIRFFCEVAEAYE